MVEKETLYNFAILGIIAVCVLVIMFIFVIKPATDKSLSQKNFEEQRNIFLAKYCENLKFTSFKLQDISTYNGYCFTESSPMVRVISYFHYDYDIKDGSYTFWILQERK